MTLSRIFLIVVVAPLVAAIYWLSKPWQLSPWPDRYPAGIELRPVAGARWTPGQPLFIAIVGTDIREHAKSWDGGRADAVHILAVRPDGRAGTIVNFPRHSLVDIPGHGKSQLNAAYAFGGPDLLNATLEQLVGFPIHYQVRTDFSHFERWIDRLGGIDVDVPFDIIDDPLQIITLRKGPHHLDGNTALRFARVRASAPNGDLSRTDDHGIVIKALMNRVAAKLREPHGVTTQLLLLRDIFRTTVPPDRLALLATVLSRLRPEALANVTVPGRDTVVAGHDTVLLAPGDLFERIRDDGIY